MCASSNKLIAAPGFSTKCWMKRDLLRYHAFTDFPMGPLINTKFSFTTLSVDSSNGFTIIKGLLFEGG